VITNGATGESLTRNSAIAALLPLEPAGNSYSAVIDYASNAGKFEITRVVPGSYNLYVQIRPSAQAGPVELLWDSMPIEVQGQDIENISIAAKPALPLHGKVVVEGRPNNDGASPATGLFVAMRPDPFITPQAPSPSTRVLSDGTFSLPDVIAGNYRAYVPPLLKPTTNPGLLWGLPPAPPGLQNTYVKSIQVGGADVLDSGFRITAAENLSMEIVLGTNPGTLNGRVMRTEDGKQVAAPGITVGAVPAATVARGFRSDMHRATLTDATGSFQLRDLPPGGYRVFAWEEADKDAVMDLDFLRANEDKGTRIHINEGEKQMIELNMIPARTQ
jgi:hypothetical protein